MLRERWIIRNIFNKTITIGDLSKCPAIPIGKAVDLLAYHTKTEIEQSIVLRTLLLNEYLRLEKDQDNEITTYTGSDAVDSITISEDSNAGAGPGGSVSWGDIEGTLSDQTDLQSALNSKPTTLVGLSDVSVDGTPANGDILWYNNGSQKWENIDLDSEIGWIVEQYGFLTSIDGASLSSTSGTNSDIDMAITSAVEASSSDKFSINEAYGAISDDLLYWNGSQWGPRSPDFVGTYGDISNTSGINADIQTAINAIDLSSFATTGWTENAINGAIAGLTLGSITNDLGFITSTDLDDYISGAGFITLTDFENYGFSSNILIGPEGTALDFATGGVTYVPQALAGYNGSTSTWEMTLDGILTCTTIALLGEYDSYSPGEGTLAWSTSTHKLMIFNGLVWEQVTSVPV